MNIIYKQPEEDQNSGLCLFGVHNCYFKKLSFDRDQMSITKKAHHHTGFEIHIVTEGYEKYEVAGATYKLESGNFLIIYPNVEHTVITSLPHTQKYSIAFYKQTEEHLNCFFGTLTKRISNDLAFISNEVSFKKEISVTLIENNILEIIVLAFRLSGIKENKNIYKQDENVIISLAKQYIDDNIEMAPNVAAVSEYCNFSAKQLARIFKQFENVSPGEYIKKQRIKRIEKMLADSTLSLKQISETMNFNNEYYFNTFFKKHAGMPPGEYRKMLGK